MTDEAAWAGLSAPGYCWYKNEEATFKETYGALYNWYTVSTGKLCPAGWHVPSDEEWTELTDYLGGEGKAGGKLKEKGTAYWVDPNTGATNEYGFTAQCLPASATMTVNFSTSASVVTGGLPKSTLNQELSFGYSITATPISSDSTTQRRMDSLYVV